MTTIVLEGDKGYTKTNIVDLEDDSTVDASAAAWTVANCKSDPLDGCNTGSVHPINRFPFNVRRSKGVTVLGGLINGEVPLLDDWRNVYTDINDGTSCNSKAVIMTDCDDAVYKNWRIDSCWDGISVAGSSSNFLIQDCHFSNVRDDTISNAKRRAGEVRNCLIDGCFIGFSLVGDTDESAKEFIVDGVLARQSLWLAEGDADTHPAMFKIQGETFTPRIRIRNSIIAISKAAHRSYSHVQRAWNICTESSGNYFLNLSDDPLPADYPKSFPLLGGGDWVGFTVLEGQDARDHWDAARATWLGEFVEPVPEEPPALGKRIARNFRVFGG